MPRKTQHSREKFIEAGIALVQRQSFDGIGVAEIAKVSGAPKGSFYNYFESKDIFGEAMMDAYADREIAGMREMYMRAKGSPLEKLRTVIASFRDLFLGAEFEGCLVGCMAATSGNDSACREASVRAFSKSKAVIEEFFEEAREAGELSDSVDTRQLAGLLQNMMQGAMIVAKAKGDGQAFDDVLDAFFPLISKGTAGPSEDIFLADRDK
jgi:TetR/AcrR family transcriptional repressor of nem operon